MRAKLLLMIGITLYLIACKKEVSSIPTSDKFLIGMTSSDIMINQYDTLLVGGYHNLLYFDLDVNGDKNPDFRLTSEIWGSPGLGYHPIALIYSLNSNCMIYGKSITDTAFFNRDSIIYYNDPSYKIVKYNIFNYSCKRNFQNDSVLEIKSNQFHITPLFKNDYINNSEFFKADTSILVDSIDSNVSGFTISNDTAIWNYYNYDNSCNSFKNDEICYIGIKIKTMNSEKLGWIRLSISESYKILLFESAIEK
jgi:hypothetical protein